MAPLCLCTFIKSSLDSGMLSLGETGELSPNASAMLRISTLSAWAQLQVATPHQTYLEAVVKPYRPTLSTLWIAALRDYASIRVDSEFLHDTSSVALDSSYSSLGKEVLLPVSKVHQMYILPLKLSPVLCEVMVCDPTSGCDCYGAWRSPSFGGHGRPGIPSRVEGA
jgi:hypothetical protein